METAKNFVGGSLVDARVREEIDVPDPATGELLGRAPVSGPEDVDRAVRAAQEAYEEWSLEPVTQRARRMFRLQVLLEERIDELAEIATRENEDSFFGDLHATGRDGVEFYTERKVVIDRWQ